VGLLLFATTLPAQVNWVQSFPKASPPHAKGRLSGGDGMVYDRVRGQTVLTLTDALYGSSSANMDVWTWDAKTWNLVKPATRPPGRINHMTAFDTTRGELVMFGGIWYSGTSNTFFGDTWVWNGSQWRLAATSGPRPRHSSSMAYDAARKQVVLFGGYIGMPSSPLADTWVWDGKAWSQKQPSKSPPGVSGHQLAFDQRRGRVVLFGGNTDSRTPVANIWEWDGNTWLKQNPTSGPVARTDHMMAYDPSRGRVVVYGGHDACCSKFYGDTWEWDGKSWFSRKTAKVPSANYIADFVYDETQERMVLFGGFTGPTARVETWTYGATRPGAISLIGAGCSSSNSQRVPRLMPATGLRPYVGDYFDLLFVNVGPGPRAALLYFGSTLAKPVSLAPFGMSGCMLYVNLQLPVALSLSGIGSTLRVTIPADTALIGASLGSQGLFIDAGANALGVGASEGIQMTAGAK